MALDLHTIFILFSILALMFSGLLVLAGLHAGDIKGIKHWALANLFIGIGLGASHFFSIQTPGHQWAFVLSATLITAGIGLQYLGIRAFKNSPYDWRILLVIVGIAFIQNHWFVILQPDISARSVANSLLFGMVYATCARELLIKVESPLKTAYWFTGACFTVFSLLMGLRAITILWVQPGSTGLFIDIPLNQVSFLFSSLVQLCVTFGFVLMLNYRLVLDLQKIASRDVLTGAFNRRRLEEEAERLRVRCLRTGESLAIMMIDIDDFKLINDKFGHQGGDEVLRHLVTISLASIRADDYFARYGGEEFCILLPNTTEKDALVLAERLRKTCEATTAIFKGEPLRSTISIGVADSNSAGLEVSSLISVADQALYFVKQAGKNRVAAYSTMSLVEKAE